MYKQNCDFRMSRACVWFRNSNKDAQIIATPTDCYNRIFDATADNNLNFRLITKKNVASYLVLFIVKLGISHCFFDSVPEGRNY